MDTTACRPAEVAFQSPEFPGLCFEAVSAGFRGLGGGGPCNSSWQDRNRKFATVIAGRFGVPPISVSARKRTNRNVDLRISYLVRTQGMAAFAPLLQALGLKVRHPSHCGDSNRFADLSAMSAQSSANGQVYAPSPTRCWARHRAPNLRRAAAKAPPMDCRERSTKVTASCRRKNRQETNSRVFAFLAQSRSGRFSNCESRPETVAFERMAPRF